MCSRPQSKKWSHDVFILTGHDFSRGIRNSVGDISSSSRFNLGKKRTDSIPQGLIYKTQHSDKSDIDLFTACLQSDLHFLIPSFVQNLQRLLVECHALIFVLRLPHTLPLVIHSPLDCVLTLGSSELWDSVPTVCRTDHLLRLQTPTHSESTQCHTITSCNNNYFPDISSL